MKKLITFCLILLAVFTVCAQVQYSGTLHYRTTPENSWDGIDADINVGIKGSTSAGGVGFYETIYDITIKSIKIRQREIPASQVPANVLSKLKNDLRVTLSFDLYVNSTFVKRMETKTSIGWAQLQGLDNAEGYKQAVQENGYKLFNNGALSIQNVAISGGMSYSLDSDYRNAVEKEIAGGDKTTVSSSSKISNNDVTELGLSMSGSDSDRNPSSDQAAGSANTEIPSLESQYAKIGIPANTPTYTKSEITTQVVTQAAGIVGGLLDDWNANRERRIEAEQAAYKRQQSIEAGERIKKDQEKFVAKFLPLLDQANRGDENARMTLYFASASLYSKEYVPLRDQWFEEALKNNNTDAIVEVARITAGKPGSDYDFKKAIPYLEKAASLGNVDAMVILGSWYSIIPTTTTYKGISSFLDGGQNPKLALEMFRAAAERGSPNAMYYLGMIYKYGQIYDLAIKKYNKAYVKFDIIPDEKVSLDWFMKSLNPDYEESLYSKSLLYNDRIYNKTSSYFNPSSNFEISTSFIYNKKGKVVSGYEEQAKEFEKIRIDNTSDIINRQKFHNIE